jgi:outer membrane biosynthesis protein TonB
MVRVDGGIQSAIMTTDMYRENLHVEIALLASLLLHAFAFGSWQYRDALMKLTGLSSFARFAHVEHAPERPAEPRVQTMTFVEVDEPRAKKDPREKEAQRFMETDASQVTGEKPKDAHYYSDKSTVAANPDNPTGKQADTPYVNGKETRALNPTDVPSPSGVAAPLITQAGAPGAPGKPAPPTPPTPPAPHKAAEPTPPAQPAPTTPPQPQTPEQPKEVPALGIQMVEEQKVAMAPKPPSQPDVVTGSDVSTPPPPTPGGDGGTPSVASEPGTPGREIVSRKAHLTVAGVTRSGVAAFGVEENPFGAYDKKIIKAVQSRWYALIDRFGMYERAGAVTVHFELLDDGQVQNIKVSENTAGQILSLFCEKAVIESGPFDPLPENLRALVGKEPRDASFTFYY